MNLILPGAVTTSWCIKSGTLPRPDALGGLKCGGHNGVTTTLLLSLLFCRYTYDTWSLHIRMHDLHLPKEILVLRQ